MYNFITRLIDSPADLFSETSWTQKNKTKPRLAGWLIGSTIILSMGHATAQNYTLETIAEGLDTPWSIAELPNGGFLITERTGGL